MRLGVVVVHYRNWPDVADTVRDVLASSATELVVLDNASGDGSTEKLRAEFPSVRVVESPVNGGYASGVNAGVRALPPCDALAVLSHEVRLAPGAMELLVARLAEAPEVGAAGPLVGHLDRRDEVWSAGGILDRAANWTVRHRTSPEAGPYAVDWLDGCLTVFRASAFRAMDEGYVSYLVEVDHCLDLARRGWTVECVPAARAWQRPGRVPLALWERNRLRLVARHGGLAELARVLRNDVREIRRDREKERMRGVRAFLTRRLP